MKTICLFKLIRLPEDSDQLSSFCDLLKGFSISSLEAYDQPVFEDDPKYQFTVRLVQHTGIYSATASIIFMDSMINFMIVVSMKGEADSEPFTDALDWETVQRFEN